MPGFIIFTHLEYICTQRSPPRKLWPAAGCGRRTWSDRPSLLPSAPFGKKCPRQDISNFYPRLTAIFNLTAKTRKSNFSSHRLPSTIPHKLLNVIPFFELHPNVLPFQYGMQIPSISPRFLSALPFQILQRFSTYPSRSPAAITSSPGMWSECPFGKIIKSLLHLLVLTDGFATTLIGIKCYIAQVMSRMLLDTKNAR